MRKRKARFGELLRDGLRAVVTGVVLVSGVAAANAAPTSLMLYGDSLMAGYGLAPEDGFAAQLQAALAADGFEVSIVNASVSGDTSGDALARLDWSLAERPDAVLLGLGGNDMLQGLAPARLEQNLTKILDRLRTDQVPVLLLGMQASPGLGNDYVGAFNAIYPGLAKTYGVSLYPFFLDGVALDPKLNQADRIHPNAKGVQSIVSRVLPAVEALLQGVGQGKP